MINTTYNVINFIPECQTNQPYIPHNNNRVYMMPKRSYVINKGKLLNILLNYL